MWGLGIVISCVCCDCDVIVSNSVVYYGGYVWFLFVRLLADFGLLGASLGFSCLVVGVGCFVCFSFWLVVNS